MTARVITWALSAWSGWRWLTVALGLARVRAFEGDARREARRACVTRAAVTVFLSVGALYAWAFALDLQPTADFVGFLAAVLMTSLVVGLAAAFMQPPQRTPETLGIFRIRRLRPPRPSEDVG